MKIGRLNHVAIAVPSIEEAWKTYKNVYGVSDSDITPIEEMETQGVKYSFVNVDNSQIELLEPLGENSPIRKFLEKNPLGGQHHVCFEVADINEAYEAMTAKGVRVLGSPRIGAHGTPIFFMHPKESNGVLIELMETPKEQH